LAAELIAEVGLRGADAVYVATAHHLNVPLVTPDREQRARAGRLVEVQSPGPVGG
jgi:predicted nucleic acid-binding protein